MNADPATMLVLAMLLAVAALVLWRLLLTLLAAAVLVTFIVGALYVISTASTLSR
jgi:hypothetical protein